MTDQEACEGLSAADQGALDDLRRTKELIVGLLDDESLPAHVRSKLLTEHRQYVLAIAELERRRPERKKPSIIDELRERRAGRLLEIAEQYGTQEGPR